MRISSRRNRGADGTPILERRARDCHARRVVSAAQPGGPIRELCRRAMRSRRLETERSCRFPEHSLPGAAALASLAVGCRSWSWPWFPVWPRISARAWPLPNRWSTCFRGAPVGRDGHSARSFSPGPQRRPVGAHQLSRRPVPWRALLTSRSQRLPPAYLLVVPVIWSWPQFALPPVSWRAILR